jgi:hypothetical protein
MEGTYVILALVYTRHASLAGNDTREQPALTRRGDAMARSCPCAPARDGLLRDAPLLECLLDREWSTRCQILYMGTAIA